MGVEAESGPATVGRNIASTDSGATDAERTQSGSGLQTCVEGEELSFYELFAGPLGRSLWDTAWRREEEQRAFCWGGSASSVIDPEGHFNTNLFDKGVRRAKFVNIMSVVSSSLAGHDVGF